MPAAVERLVEHLHGLDSVKEIQVNDSWHPARVTVSLTTRSVPDNLSDLMDYYGAPIVDCHVGDSPGPLSITVSVSQRWKDGGVRTVRNSGTSAMVTLPPEALGVGGFEYGDDLDIHARPGEIHIRDHEDGPRLP